MESNQSHRTTVSRERIISEAIDLAREQGWSKVTVRAIAGRLNYKPPVLYQYFENKDALTRSIVERGFDLLHYSVVEAVEAETSSDEKLLALAVARFRFAKENEAMHSLMFATDSPEWFKKTVFDGMCKGREIAKRLMKEIACREDECMDLITNFIALIKGYTFFATQLPPDLARERFFGDTDAEEALREAMTRFITSIKPQ